MNQNLIKKIKEKKEKEGRVKGETVGIFKWYSRAKRKKKHSNEDISVKICAGINTSQIPILKY